MHYLTTLQSSNAATSTPKLLTVTSQAESFIIQIKLKKDKQNIRQIRTVAKDLLSIKAPLQITA